MKKGSKHTAESIAKMSASHTGYKPTPACRAKMSEINAGHGNPMHGKKHPPHIRRKMSELQTGEKHAQYTHGWTAAGKRHPLYTCWINMRRRCYSPTATAYEHYGGRGITVCQRWREAFVNFLEDMQEGWAPGLSIDRIDPDGRYEPGNCRWATRKQQSNNQRRHKRAARKKK